MRPESLAPLFAPLLWGLVVFGGIAAWRWWKRRRG
jgi:MYXO-CTERM domain-containing protein